MKTIQDIINIDAKKNGGGTEEKCPSTIKELKLNNNLLLEDLCDLKPFTNLRILDLSNNNFKSFSFLKNLKNLNLLKLSNNNLTDMLDLIPNISNIKVLHLNNNKITRIPDSIKDMVNLQALIINDNQISEIENLPFSLETLIISRNMISAFAPAPIMQTLTKLKKISASHNRFTALPLDLGRSHLRELRLGNNLISNCAIQKEKERSLPVCIQILDVGNNSISSIEDLKNIFTMLPLLRNLNLSCNPICDNKSYSIICQKLSSKRLNTLDNKAHGMKYQNPSNKNK